MTHTIMNQLRIPAALAAIGLLVAPAALGAQDALPTVSVVSFNGAFSVDEGNALADELAMRLVETRRFRVLQREWLPASAGPVRPGLDQLREAAVAADVEYLVLGSVAPASGYASPVRAAGSLLGAAMASRSHSVLPPPSSPARDQFVSVHVRIIDARTGHMVRSAVARGGGLSRGVLPPVFIPGLLLGGPIGAIRPTAMPRIDRSRLSAGAQHAILDIAQTLNLSSVPGPVPAAR